MARGSGTLGSVLGRFLLASRRVRMAIAVLLVVAFVGAGVVQLLPLAERKARIQAAETTTGTVVEADRRRNVYEVKYTYTVDGKTYESTRLFPGPYATGETVGPEAMSAVPSVESGETVTVHYLPDDPDHAWLATRDDLVSRHVVYFFVSGFLAVLLLAYLYVERKLPALLGDGDQSGGSAGTAANPFGPASMLEEFDPQDPPTEAEMAERMADQLPDEAVEAARTPDGDLDFSRLEGYADRAGGSRGTVGRFLGVLKGVAIVVATGTVLLLASSVFVLQVLTP